MRDIPSVVDLHRRVFPLADGAAPDRRAVYHAYFTEMYLDAPWSASRPSLVYEDDDGTPIGFLGVMSRAMSLRGRPVRAAISSQFIVEPARRATMAAIELIKALLAGPQDLTLADEASDVSRKLWEGLGGHTALPYSLYWVRLLRPAVFALQRWSLRRGGAARMWIPVGRLADAVLARSMDGAFHLPVPQTSGEDLDGDALASAAVVVQDRALRPSYDGRVAAWLLQMLARKPGCGILRSVLVRTAGEVAGWYVYCAGRDGVAEVLQVGAREGRIGDVLDHLFAQAWREGAVALVGRIDPRCVDAFSARRCIFHHRGHWMLVHAKDPELLRVIQQGDAFLTRLEGEWSMRFQGGYA